MRYMLISHFLKLLQYYGIFASLLLCKKDLYIKEKMCKRLNYLKKKLSLYFFQNDIIVFRQVKNAKKLLAKMDGSGQINIVLIRQNMVD